MAFVNLLDWGKQVFLPLSGGGAIDGDVEINGKLSINGDTLVNNSPIISEQTLLDRTYPIGSVYISYNSTSPAELLGGSWAAFTEVFPYFNNGIETGGSNTHTLTIAQMPSHRHTPVTKGNISVGGWYASSGVDWPSIRNGGASANLNDQLMVTYTGGGESHNNMPAYQTLYAWRRTA